MKAKLEAFLSKRVAGIPVTILLAIAAIVLAFLAYRAKKTPDSGEGVDGSGSGEPGSGTGGDQTAGHLPIFLAGGNLSTASGDGSSPVTSSSTTEAATVDDNATLNDISVPDNSTWLNKSIAYLVSTGVDASTATTALSAFLEGDSLSFAQGQLRDRAVAKYGVPPVAPAPTSTELYNGPATKQGTPPLTHRVVGSSDNQPSELALLYYGSNSAGNIALIKSGGDRRDLYAVGDSVRVPAPVAVISPYIPIVQSAPSIEVATRTATGTGSVTAIPTSLASSPAINYPVQANEKLSAFQGRVYAQYGFTPSYVQLQRLNPSKLTTLEKMYNSEPHGANELLVKS